MAQQPFHFKQFSVAHDRSTHKVGTDAVVLGSWVNIMDTDTDVLDVGTGSGVIALMLAQRTTKAAHIDALEIHQHDAEQARDNVTRSPWPDKISIYITPAQQFQTEKRYDLVVSNPPYFERSLRPPDEKRTTARHTHDLSFEDLLEMVSRVIKPEGRFAVILPYAEAMRFSDLAENFKLHPLRRTYFRTRTHKPVERILIEFSRHPTSVITSELILYGDGEQWSDGYRSLTRDFYLSV